MAGPLTVEEYLAGLPAESREMLEEIRRRVHAAVPGLDEVIKYRMPTFARDGRSVMHLAAWKKHLSVYPVPAVDDTVAEGVARWADGEGTLKFPLAEPIPYDFIARVAALLDAQR